MREAKLLDRDDRLRVELALGQPLFLDGFLDLLLRGHADLPKKLAHRLVESLIHRNAPSDYLFGVVRRRVTDVKTASGPGPFAFCRGVRSGICRRGWGALPTVP